MEFNLQCLLTESPKSEMRTYAYLHRDTAGTHGNIRRHKHMYKDRNRQDSLLQRADLQDTNMHSCWLKDTKVKTFNPSAHFSNLTRAF